MFRSPFFIFLAGVLAVAQPAFAGPYAAPASDRVQAAAATPKQPAPLPTPAAGDGRGTAPAGFGWG